MSDNRTPHDEFDGEPGADAVPAGEPGETPQWLQPTPPIRLGKRHSAEMQRWRFLQAYLANGCTNASAAAREAGYSDVSKVAPLLQRPDVRRFLAQQAKAVAATVGITAERVLAEVASIAFFDPRSVLEWGPDGVTLRDSKNVPAAARRAVAAISEAPAKWPDAPGKVTVKFHDKQRALDMLMKYLGLYAPEKHEHTVEESDAPKQLSPEEARARILKYGRLIQDQLERMRTEVVDSPEVLEKLADAPSMGQIDHESDGEP